MKCVIALCAFVLVAFTALGAWSQCTISGTYSTNTKTISAGRASEAWCGDVGPGRHGNTENALSWNGSVLGAQWKVWGMYIDETGAVETGRNINEFGNGWIDTNDSSTQGAFLPLLYDRPLRGPVFSVLRPVGSLSRPADPSPLAPSSRRLQLPC
jgi:hypothetical protein